MHRLSLLSSESTSCKTFCLCEAVMSIHVPLLKLHVLKMLPESTANIWSALSTKSGYDMISQQRLQPAQLLCWTCSSKIKNKEVTTEKCCRNDKNLSSAKS